MLNASIKDKLALEINMNIIRMELADIAFKVKMLYLNDLEETSADGKLQWRTLL